MGLNFPLFSVCIAVHPSMIYHLGLSYKIGQPSKVPSAKSHPYELKTLKRFLSIDYASLY
jgi:hypothetical protein